MAISTTYICDMCKAESNTTDQFWTFQLSLRGFNKNGGYKKTFDTCRNCAEKFGMLPYIKTSKPEDPPSIEDLLREVISRLKDE